MVPQKPLSICTIGIYQLYSTTTDRRADSTTITGPSMAILVYSVAVTVDKLGGNTYIQLGGQKDKIRVVEF